ncbi:hypothetical protein MPSEU_000069000 [Mayamaea pseudoterrestris]|nr:hypothetical protein MPSEU_000069000 [Mayamaea pseudoterrestris]
MDMFDDELNQSSQQEDATSCCNDKEQESWHYRQQSISSIMNCCLLSPHQCRLSNGQEDLEKQAFSLPFRFVLAGPAQSGKSSLLFQLACSMAASDASTSVVYIRAQDDEAENDSGRIETSLPLEGCCLAELQDMHAAGTTNQVPAAAHSSLPLTSYLDDPEVLARIHVHHVVCIRDVYQLLLSGKALSSETGPTTLIVLDDLDRLFPTVNQQYEFHKQDPHMAISQLLSVLVDTANHGSDGPISVAISLTAVTTSCSASHGRTMPMLFSPTLSLKTIELYTPSTNDITHKELMAKASVLLQQHYPDMVVASCWCLEMASCAATTGFQRYYAIVSNAIDSDNAGKEVMMHLGDRSLAKNDA